MLQVKGGVVPAVVGLGSIGEVVVHRNHQHRDVAVLSPVIDLIEEGLSVLGAEVVSLSWVLAQRLGCFLEENGVSFLIKV